MTDWRYCPSNLNPADVGTRVIMPKNKKKFLSWFKGPWFLLLLESSWPRMPLEKDQIVDVTSLFINKREIKNEVTLKALAPSDIFLTLISYYSDIQRLIRAICYIFRALRACSIINKRKRKSFLNLVISLLFVHKHKVAEQFVVKPVQKDYFWEPCSCIESLIGSVCQRWQRIWSMFSNL